MNYAYSRTKVWTLALVLLTLFTGSFGQNTNTLTIASASQTSRPVIDRAGHNASFSSISEYIGTYGSDGIFRNSPESRWSTPQGQSEVPPTMQRDSIESVVEDYPPPRRAVRRLRSHSILGDLRDQFVTLAYGHQRILGTPTHVLTDSTGRVIVTDPANSAVHVLDGKNSFRIQGGAGRRLQHPYALAIDADDNIYLTDITSTHVLVYDRFGRFLREIGTTHDEDLFDKPTAIAVEPRSGRLYVLDTPMQELIVLSLDGKFLSRVGGSRSHTRGVRFDSPSELAVRGNTVAVVDRFGTRVQVFNTDLTQLSSFDIAPLPRNPWFPEIGLAIDGQNNILVQQPGSPELKVYDRHGKQLLTTQTSRAALTFIALGLWIDDTDRIFVTDGSAGAVHVFRKLVATQAHDPAPTASGGY